MGAWIETASGAGATAMAELVAPRVGAWIETSIYLSIPNDMNNVAPRVGAWIETHKRFGYNEPIESHPVWVRGLKLNCRPRIPIRQKSHPVWVRGLKLPPLSLARKEERRTPCGCVD